MTLTQFLNEKWLMNRDSKIGVDEFYSKKVDYFINPTMKEIREIEVEWGAVRGLIDAKGNLYAWSGRVFHWRAVEYLGFNEKDLSRQDMGIKFIPVNYVHWSHSWIFGEDWAYRYRPQTIERINLLLHKASKKNPTLKFVDYDGNTIE